MGSRTVRGIVDWDGGKKSCDGVVVFSEGRAYSIENVILDPLCVVSLIVNVAFDKYRLSDFCGKEVGVNEWAENDDLLQRTVEVFVSKVIGDAFQADAVIEYVSGFSLKTDSRYLHSASETGHTLESKILKVFPELKKIARREGDLKRVIASVHMTQSHSARFIPTDFQQVFLALQAT